MLMRIICLLGVLSAAVTVTGADEKKIFADADEAKTWAWLLDRADKKQHVERDGKGKLQWVGFWDEEKQRGNRYAGSLAFGADGRVEKMTFNAAHFRNEDFKKIATFRGLKILTAWHNGWDKAQKDKSVYSGAGLVHLKETAIESINFGGSFFNDDGIKAAVKLPTLKSLIVYHTRVTDAGVAALAGDDHIELVRLGPQYSNKVSEKSIIYLVQMKALKQLELNEMRLTWDGGLKHLVKLKDQLEVFVAKNSLIEEADLAKLKAAMPNTKIEYTRAEQKYVDRMLRQ